MPNGYTAKFKAADFLLLLALFFLYSLDGVFSKYAALEPFFSARFILLYGFILLELALYAFLWQKILKKVPLTVAYPCKAVTVIYGMIWGSVLFHEKITWNMIFGGLVIGVGIFLMVTEHE